MHECLQCQICAMQSMVSVMRLGMGASWIGNPISDYVCDACSGAVWRGVWVWKAASSGSKPRLIVSLKQTSHSWASATALEKASVNQAKNGFKIGISQSQCPSALLGIAPLSWCYCSNGRIQGAWYGLLLIMTCSSKRLHPLSRPSSSLQDLKDVMRSMWHMSQGGLRFHCRVQVLTTETMRCC